MPKPMRLMTTVRKTTPRERPRRPSPAACREIRTHRPCRSRATGAHARPGESGELERRPRQPIPVRPEDRGRPAAGSHPASLHPTRGRRGSGARARAGGSGSPPEPIPLHPPGDRVRGGALSKHRVAGEQPASRLQAEAQRVGRMSRGLQDVEVGGATVDLDSVAIAERSSLQPNTSERLRGRRQRCAELLGRPGSQSRMIVVGMGQADPFHDRLSNQLDEPIDSPRPIRTWIQQDGPSGPDPVAEGAIQRQRSRVVRHRHTHPLAQLAGRHLGSATPARRGPGESARTRRSARQGWVSPYALERLQRPLPTT